MLFSLQQGCVLCCKRHHQKHCFELIEAQKEGINQELIDLRRTLNSTIHQHDDMMGILKENRTRKLADIKWSCDKIQESVNRDISDFRLQQNQSQQREQKRIDELKVKQKKIQEEADRKIAELQQEQDRIKLGIQRSISELELDEKRIQEVAKRSADTIKYNKDSTRFEIDQTLMWLAQQKKSLESEQIFLDILYEMGNESDKLSRVPGMKSNFRKQFPGKGLASSNTDRTLNANKANSAEALVETLVKKELPFFVGLHCIKNVSMSCGPAYSIRPATLFNQPHIIHTCDVENSDKICIHNISMNCQRRISVRGMKQCGNTVVLDATAGLVVVADQIEQWSEKMRTGRARTHLSGSLHWLTFNRNYDIINHAVSPLQCGQFSYMNVSHDGHLLLLTQCTTSEHHNYLEVHHKNRCVLRTIALPDMCKRPMSAVSIGADKFVVVDTVQRMLLWIDHRGQVLRQYGQGPGEELCYPIHIAQHSKGQLLVTDRASNKIHLLSTQGQLLQYLLQEPEVRSPLSLHVDEHTGQLYVVQWKNSGVSEMNIFQFFFPAPGI